MRCSACEPLLDCYVEGTLAAPVMRRVATHLQACAHCARLFAELKVVDALLFTTQPVTLPENFTFAVMAETTTLRAPRARQHPAWGFIVIYLAAVWAAIIAGLAAAGVSPVEAAGRLGNATAPAFNTANTALQNLGHAFAPASPSLAAYGAAIFGLDCALAAIFALVYFVIRPRLGRVTVRE